MSDEAEIQRVITSYSQFASKGDWGRVRPLFLPEAVWEIPHLGMKLDGREAIAETLLRFKQTMEYVLQINCPALIEVDGDSARATSAIRECGKSAGKDEGFEYLGIYADELVRTDKDWQFRYRIFEGIGSHLFALTSGVSH